MGRLKVKTPTSVFLCSFQGLQFLHSRIPTALERWLLIKVDMVIATHHFRHGEGRLDLEQLYAIVLPYAYKTATTKFGASLLLRLGGRTS